LNDSVLEELKKKEDEKESKSVALAYTDFQVMELLHVLPDEYFALHRWDRVALKYYFVMKGYYDWKDDKFRDQERKKADAEAERLRNAPKQKGR